MSLICGIDEVARGPCIGPLIIVGVLVEEKDLTKLKSIGVRDSKLLIHKKRELLAEKIKKIAKKIEVLIIQPKEIDSALESESLNLNRLEAIKSAMIINSLKPDKAIIDCPSPNREAYTNYVRKLLKDKNIELLLMHKAEKFEVVAAASILAKCIREEEVKKIEKMVGESIGSGYPSNEVCQKFLKDNWDKYPEIFRKSWVTWRDHKIAKAQKKLSDF